MGGEEELYERFYSDGKLPESMCYKDIHQCSSSTWQSKNVKSTKKKVKGKVSSAIAKAKSKDVSGVDVKYDGSLSSAVRANKTGQAKVEAIDANSFLESLALEDGLDIHAYSGKRS